MKIVSNFMNEFTIAPGEVNTICFKTNAIQQKFKEYLIQFFNNRKKKETTYVSILNEYGEQLKGREFEFIYFDCSSISLVDEKDTKKLFQDMLFHQLENNPLLVDSFTAFRQYVEQFITTLQLKYDKITVDFEFSDKTIEQMIKSLHLIVESTEKEADFIPNYELRINLIQSLLNMSVKRDNAFLFITFPETDIGVSEYNKIISYLHELGITVLVLTANREFVLSTPIENVTLVRNFGTIYDIIGLRNELIAFKYCTEGDANWIAKDLAFRDFTNDVVMLREDYKLFL